MKIKTIHITTILTVIISLHSTISVGAPKELVCVSSAEEEADRMANSAERNARIHNSLSDYMRNALGDRYLKESKSFHEKAEKCKNSSFGWKYSYVFDTDGLKDTTKNKAELKRENCGGSSTAILEVTLSATPSVISFISKSKRTSHRFNINRRDLTAGIDTERNFTCELRDVDMSGNLL